MLAAVRRESSVEKETRGKDSQDTLTINNPPASTGQDS